MTTFFRVCNILSRSIRSGVFFLAEKFNFAKEEVEFSGIIISKDGIRLTDKYLLLWNLLSPKTEFVWNGPLEEAFVASKKEIARLLQDRVKAYDPELTTCISLDYSNTGMGWILQQKTCKCQYHCCVALRA